MAKSKNRRRKRPKNAAPTKAGGIFAYVMNRLLLVANIAALGFAGYHGYLFLKEYSGKTPLLFSQGRILTIDTNTNSVELSDISAEHFEQLKLEFTERNAEQPEVAKQSDDTYGPPQAVKAEETLAAEPPKPLDYKTANLAVIVTETGTQQEFFDLARKLPKEVSIALSPYSDDIENKISLLISEGRTPLINIMMQPTGFPLKDNGPMSIQLNYDEQTNLRRLENMIKISDRIKGALAVNDEIVTTKTDKFIPLLKALSEKNIFFGYFKTTNNTLVENEAKPLAADIFGVDYLVDDNPSPEEMLAMLNRIKEELVVRKRRLVIAIRPYPNSIDVMEKWLKENIGATIQIAPVSYFVTDN